MMIPQRTVSFKRGLMHVHPHACVCIINERQKVNSLENITWSELGKQNIQAKKVYSFNYGHKMHRRFTQGNEGSHTYDQISDV